MVLVAISTAGVNADIIISGIGDLTVNGAFQSNQNFTIEFVADQPAVDTSSDTNQGVFIGTTTLTLDNPALGVTGLESTNVNALRQDGNNEGVFLAADSNPFNVGFSAVFSQGGVIDDPNVYESFFSTPQAAQFQGAGLVWVLSDEDESTVQFNQVSTISVVATAAVPEPTATTILIAGTALLALRRRK